MTITNYAIKSNDIIFCQKLKNSESDYCIFGIDFDKVICYKIAKSVWKDRSPAISVSIIMETGKRYALLKKTTSDSEEILNKIINPDKKQGIREEYSTEHQEMMPKYGEIEQVVDLKYIFDLLIYG